MSILDIDTVALVRDKSGEEAIRIIDQTKLPAETVMLDLKTGKEIWDAIYLLQVRGAPAIGVAAGFGIYLLTSRFVPPLPDTAENFAMNREAMAKEFSENKDYLDSSRPTAVNLSWALKRMEGVFNAFVPEDNTEKPVAALKERLRLEAELIRAEDIEVSRRIGENGLSLLKPGDGILTHCNAGQLATIRYGTATAPIYLGQERGYGFHVYSDETRPLLQGTRLTSYELKSAGVDVTLICDNMSATVMRQGKVQAVIVGCDRVASNGDTANKIGTSMAALAARRYHIPFYVAAPTSTIDMSLSSGAEIVIEERKPEEITEMWYEKRMAPEGVKVFNPAFDVTDSDLITGIITEYGVARAPYTESLKAIFEEKAAHPVTVKL